MINKYLLMFLSGLVFSGIHAQVAITSAGGNSSGSQGSVSYSIGQVFYSSYFGSTGFVTQGVQQTYDISIVTALEETNHIHLVVAAFPNPAHDFLTLKVDGFSNPQSPNNNSIGNRKISYRLFDLNGKILECGKITDYETRIIMSHLAAAPYFLKITDNNNKEIKQFKINKNQ